MHYTIEMIRKLLPVLMVFGGILLVGNQISLSAESKPIIFGASPYDRMKATIHISMAIVGKPKETGEVVFEHTTDQKNNFILSLLRCTKRLLNCNNLKNTEIIVKNNLNNGTYNINVSHPLKGRININAKYNGSQLELENKINLRDLPTFDKLDNVKLNMNLDNMSVFFNIKNKNGTNESGKSYIVDNNIHLIIGGSKEVINIREIPNPYAELLLNNIPGFIDSFFKFKKSTYDFSGMNVHNGEILKADVLSMWNALSPNPIKGFKVDGENTYRGREMVIIKPVVDSEFYANSLLTTGNNSIQDLISQGFSFQYNYPLMYVDKSTGVPVYWTFNLGISKNNQSILELNAVMNTEFSKSDTNNKQFLEDAKNECSSLGFTMGTENFGKCVMKLLD